jgi:dipeptidyl aminopeptidase/acylaminoacyl peptidase
VQDLGKGTRVVPLSGEHEDLGHEVERPSFSPDGRAIAFASSHGDLRGRQIWRHNLDDGRTIQLTDERGTHTDPVWSPDGRRLACIVATPFESAEVAIVDGTGIGKERLTRSMPPAWTKDVIAEPSHVLLTSADGMRIHADLWLPRSAAAGERVPGLVYVHGGPTRQMRDGWHPMHAYAVFYAFNQYLVGRGYAVISVDYRGGTGYGVDYEQANFMGFGSREMEDCIAAAEHLASLPAVDPRRLAIWGLSYGGYMTLAAMTKRPEVFALGINIAGLWDLQQWAKWIADNHHGAVPYFLQRLGGPLGQGGDVEAHRQASPKNFADGLRGPLLNLMGTADANVDFAQLDAIVRDLTERGKDFAALYYPDETHMFTRRTTWQDAFARIEAAFERYLRCEPEQRPRAMI